MLFDSGPENNSGSGGFLSRFSSGQPPIKIIGAAVVLVALGVLGVVLATSGGGGNGGGSPSTSVRPTRTAESGGLAEGHVPTVEATIDLARPTATAGHLEDVGSDDRFIISKFGVDAPLALKKVGLDGVMPDPSNPDEIAYYDFSAWPGLGGAPDLGGNTVVSGHVDSGSKPCNNGTVPPPCQAVLWDLRNIKVGDEIELRIDGKSYRYRVATSEPVGANDSRWQQIVSSTAQESLTIITCGGQFNPATREYDLRTVVTATRILT